MKNHSKYLKYYSFFIIAILIPFVFLMQACENKEPIKIGYIGGLTGRVADLGIAGRDGVILAVEEVNAAGGINGKAVKLIVKDDKQDEETARRGVDELIAEGVVSIIGHMTSSISVATLPIANEKKILMMSPTASTNDLTGIDDYFFRVYPAGAEATKRLARHALQDMGLKTMTVVYDIGNRAYTESMYSYFRKEYESLGGKVVNAVTYKSDPDTVFLELAKRATADPSDGLFILANAMDSAMLCQQLSKTGKRMPIVTGEWSATEDILAFGGRAVEGIHFFHTFDKTNQDPLFIQFRGSFNKRFGYEAGFASAHAYDAANVLFVALKKDDRPSVLRETIKSIGVYNGLQGDISFDEFGDVQREHVLMTIQGGKFQPVR